MGVFDFGKDEQKQSSADANLADKLIKMVQDAGIAIEGMALVETDGVVSIGGTAKNQEEKDKVIQMLKAAEGVADVEDALKVAGGQKHVVVSGDTLWGLAEKYYGNGAKYMDIFNANKEVWKNYNYDPNIIYVGWELMIP